METNRDARILRALVRHGLEAVRRALDPFDAFACPSENPARRPDGARGAATRAAAAPATVMVETDEPR